MSAGSFTLGVLAFDGMVLSEVAAAGDIFLIAEKLDRLRDPRSTLSMRVVLLGVDGRRRARTATGLELAVEPADAHAIDALMIPGFIHASSEELLAHMGGLDAERSFIADCHRRGLPLVSACCGGFLLAEAGLLDGREATTSWWLDGLFRRRYPAVRLDVARMIVEDGPVTTAGATTAVLGHLLQLVARTGGPELAQQTARILLVDPDRQSQAPYISQALRERPRHSLTEKAERFMQRELHGELSVARLASHCGTSERSLLRHFRTHYGTSPLAHIQHLRVERAKALLESTHLSLDEVVERCGYRDVSSFRKLFKRATRMTPADYRQRFRLRPH